jgi:hypothetical protein
MAKKKSLLMSPLKKIFINGHRPVIRSMALKLQIATSVLQIQREFLESTSEGARVATRSPEDVVERILQQWPELRSAYTKGRLGPEVGVLKKFRNNFAGISREL